MPLYLDIHKLPDEVTPEMLEQAHAKDVEIQGQHGVCYQGYWYNSTGRTVACLVEGPSREACEEVHRKAHGMVAEHIIEVSHESVHAFLGGGTLAAAGDVLLADGTQDPGLRVLVVTQIDDLVEVGSRLGDDAAVELVATHDRIARALLSKYGGREGRHMGDGLLASFTLASAAVQCALEIQHECSVAGAGTAAPAVRIGIAAGEPVTKHEGLFGTTVEQARAVCRAARVGEVLTSAAVRDLCAGKGLRFAPAPTVRVGTGETPLDVVTAVGAAERQAGSGTGHPVSVTDRWQRPDVMLGGRYAVEREIGRGGMATVYLARDVRHDRQVAVKVLRSELAALIGTERFLQEIRVAARLMHPNIVALYDSGEADGVLYYVMPYLTGETLRQLIDRERPLPLPRAIAIATSVAAGLDHAHRQGVVHRDIKPDNILMLDGQAMILDFGIALALSHAGGDRLTEPGFSLGTPAYMSPEQAAGDLVDARTDVYALGCVVYEMLAGEPPFTGTSVQSMLARILTEPAPRLATRRADLPAHVTIAVDRALAKASTDRFNTAGEFSAALAP